MRTDLEHIKASDVIWRCLADKAVMALNPQRYTAADFLNVLLKSDMPDAAVSFMAASIFQQQAIWWGCRCYTLATPAMKQGDSSRLAKVLDWLHGKPVDYSGFKMQDDENADPLTWLEFALSLPENKIIDLPQAIVAAESENPDPFSVGVGGCVKLSALRTAGKSTDEINPGVYKEFLLKFIRIGIDITESKETW